MDGDIPFWIKIAYTGLLIVILPVYAKCYGWRNFLWFSDIALIAIGIALWLESPLIVSMMAVGVLLPELVWNVSYFARLLFGWHASGLSGYMFDRKKPRFLRALSLFHVVLPVIMLWRLRDSDPRSTRGLLAWIVLLIITSAAVRPSDENINCLGLIDGKKITAARAFRPRDVVFPIGLICPRIAPRLCARLNGTQFCDAALPRQGHNERRSRQGRSADVAEQVAGINSGGEPTADFDIRSQVQRQRAQIVSSASRYRSRNRWIVAPAASLPR